MPHSRAGEKGQTDPKPARCPVRGADGGCTTTTHATGGTHARAPPLLCCARRGGAGGRRFPQEQSRLVGNAHKCGALAHFVGALAHFVVPPLFGLRSVSRQ